MHQVRPSIKIGQKAYLVLEQFAAKSMKACTSAALESAAQCAESVAAFRVYARISSACASWPINTHKLKNMLRSYTDRALMLCHRNHWRFAFCSQAS